VSLRGVFQQSPEVRPVAIRGGETAEQLLEHAFPAFVGRQVRTAWRLMKHSAENDHAVFLTMSGAMTPAGLHRSCVVPMIQHGVVDVLTTTGANLYHDAHRVIGHALREVDPQAGDTRLREARIIRIYDIGFDEDVLLDTDRLFLRLMKDEAFARPMATWEMHALLGERMHAIEQAVGVEQPCLLSACWQAGVPIFVGAPQDGSIFLNVVKLKALLGDAFKFAIDPAQDVFDMAALQWAVQQAGPTAVWILGGGVPKNYTLQGEPTLSQIFELDARGFDVDVQFCVDPVDNGALSSCPAGEGHTWGKVSAECVETSSVYAHVDVTAALPLVTSALLGAVPAKAPRRLLDQMLTARSALSESVSARKDALLADGS
jgi:deoxyhypusine synthase